VDATCQGVLSACHGFGTLVLGDTATSQIKEISCLILPSIPIFSKLFLPFRCSNQSFVCIPIVFYAFHRSRLPLFDLPVTTCSVFQMPITLRFPVVSFTRALHIFLIRAKGGSQFTSIGSLECPCLESPKCVFIDDWN
jgi:hypothetical protein